MNMEKLIEGLLNLATDLAIKIVTCLVVFVIGNYLIKRVVRMLDKSRLMKETEGTVRTFTASFIKIAMYVILAIIIVNIMGVPMASVITVLASAGVAVGMAMQGSLSNIAGGVMLLINHPFRVGDYVECSGKEGTVQSISLFYTILYTVDNKQVTIPNSNVTSTTIVNYSINGKRRLDLDFTVSYDSDIDKVKEVLLNTVTNDTRVLKNPEPFARLKAHLDSSLQFTLRVWCKNKDYWDLYYDLMERVKKDFDDNKIEIPYPQIDVHTK